MKPAPIGKGPLLWVGTNPGGGGTETHMITFLQALQGLGVDVHALVHPAGQIAAALRGSGVVLHFGHFHNSADPRGIAPLLRQLHCLRPSQLVGSFSKEYWPLALASRAGGVPLALFRHMDLRLRASTRWLLSRWPLRLFAVSHYLQERLRSQGLPAARVEYCPNPLPLSHFRRNPEARHRLRARLGVGEEDVLIGFVGAWHRGKGVFLLADALDEAHSENPRVRGLWLGGGTHEAELRARLAGRDWHHLVGWQAEVAPWYSAMDVLALPSIEPDTFGRVLVEAQAAELPVLGADIGGIPEAVGVGRSGRILPSGELGAWCAAILEMSRDGDERRRLGVAGPSFAAQFAAETVAQDFLKRLGWS
ncbi:MAG: glycosyltransferase family 4 protein [Acidithiobacillus sp.]|uniref:glycosyltransferase family 4 protein n=1 Tax=Acidithiobacillus sp. TaxID=1872118 RepID=UPI0025C264B1|nr:glycosyltransferase family 4 protein [Acidithiobacillus sp.]